AHESKKVQNLQHISNFLTILNYKMFPESALKIRLQQMQEVANTNKLILSITLVFERK
ncbi:28284_t:CDS:1, partial [Gigaspora margarita]